MKKIIGIFIMMLLIGTAIPVINTIGENTSNDNWYYLPSYPNYAPSGLPDFDQKAQNDWKQGDDWSHCVLVSFADILWWFDSKHESQDGTPGDGIDDYPLVPDFKAPGTPNPGPNTDDHNFNNVNDLQTPWNGDKSGELIEVLGYFCNTNFLRLPYRSGIIGTTTPWKFFGINRYINDVGLKNEYRVKLMYFPSFSTIEAHLKNNDGISLLIAFYNEDENSFEFGHEVAVAGINPDGYIAFSDPYWNEMNPQPNRSDYNDASIVSHDILEVDFNPPLYPGLFKFWLPEYGYGYKDGGLIHSAIIISDIS